MIDFTDFYYEEKQRDYEVEYEALAEKSDIDYEDRIFDEMNKEEN